MSESVRRASKKARTVLTTGANGGIGLATVLAVAAHGHRSVGTVRSAAGAEIVERAASKHGVEVETRLLDVNDPLGCAEAIDQVQPDVLVNNAGYALFGSVESTPEQDARQLVDTLLFSSVRLARLALPHMRQEGWGRIIFMSSLFGRVAAPPLGWYAAAKHAIEGVADVMRMEVARDGIRVVVVEPGGTRTPMLQKAQRDANPAEQGDYAESHRIARALLDQTDIFRADPSQVARVVVEALEAKNPRARYLVGYDAQILARLSPMIPSRLSDRVTRLVQGL
jgi:NAD(P)-dependent dehydrogenase (short-subunit alcohol dehydrogenase family)